MICRSKAQGIFFLLCFFISSLAAGIVEERRVVLSSAVPEFCRAAAFIDGEKLLRSPGMFGLMSELLPGVKSENITVSDLAHAYLFFASEDLKLYGVVIKKGKGDLEKLYRLFKKNSDPLFMYFKNKDLLTAAWGRGTAAVLDLKGKDKVLEKIDFNGSISAFSIVDIAGLSGNAPKKLITEFPEFKMLEHISFATDDIKGKCVAEFQFDNEKSPRKFKFLNWGLTLIVWHRTGVFRLFDQESVGKVLRFSVNDPPIGGIARRLIAGSARKKKAASVRGNLEKLGTLIRLYANAKGVFPENPGLLLEEYSADPEIFIAPYDKIARIGDESRYLSPENTSYAYCLNGIDVICPENAKYVPAFFEKSGISTEKRPFTVAVFADGHAENLRIKGNAGMSCREIAEFITAGRKKKLPEQLRRKIIENAASWDKGMRK